MVGEIESGMRVTPYHLLPTTEVFIAKLRQGVISTLSLIGDGYLGLPIESIYPQELDNLRSQGMRVAEIGALADRRESQDRFLDVFVMLGRLVAQIAKLRGYDGIVAVTHPRHAKLYKRIMGFRSIGSRKTCPYANDNPAEAMFLCFEEHKGTQLFNKYFGQKFADDELLQYYWSKDTRAYFKDHVTSTEVSHSPV